MTGKKKIIIMGAAGRDFHNFNIYFRNNEDYEIVAFTATQIPGIYGRKYPSELSGKIYPNGIPIFPEEDLTNLIKEHNIDRVVFAYSDIPNSCVMAKSAIVNAAGAHASMICRMAGLEIPVVPDSHEAGISAPMKSFLDPFVVDLRPGPEGRTLNFYFGQNSEGQIIFCYTPIEKIIGENRDSTSEFMPIMANRLVGLIPRLKNMIIRFMKTK